MLALTPSLLPVKGASKLRLRGSDSPVRLPCRKHTPVFDAFASLSCPTYKEGPWQTGSPNVPGSIPQEIIHLKALIHPSMFISQTAVRLGPLSSRLPTLKKTRLFCHYFAHQASKSMVVFLRVLDEQRPRGW